MRLTSSCSAPGSRLGGSPHAPRRAGRAPRCRAAAAPLAGAQSIRSTDASEPPPSTPAASGGRQQSASQLPHARRSLLAAAAAALAAAAAPTPQARAEPPPAPREPAPAVAFPAPPPPPPAASPDASSGAVGGSGRVEGVTELTSVSVPTAMLRLMDARKASWPAIARAIAASQWSRLAQMLVLPPFDDVRQAAFIVPWALLQQDEYAAAVGSRKAYVDFVSQLKNLEVAALQAAEGTVEGLKVQQAFLLLSASLDGFIATVPEKYVAASMVALRQQQRQPAGEGSGVVPVTFLGSRLSTGDVASLAAAGTAGEVLL